MKIAYIQALDASIYGRSNGVRVQAETWGAQLGKLGHAVDFVSPWGHYDWDSYDIVHVFGYGPWLDIVPRIHAQTKARIAFSPILDSHRSYLAQRLASHIAVPALHLGSPLWSLRQTKPYVAKYFARSAYERAYLTRSFGIPEPQIELVPLSCRLADIAFNPNREPFCLHVSILSGHHKNVRRLIEAAIKYRFRLVLAGRHGSNEFKDYLARISEIHPNIKVMGFVSEEQLKSLFISAKVFALPSLFEGVGLVALEAASYGCDIVITRQGGPKEYYSGLAHVVDPTDVDAIGTGVSRFLNGETHQPQLREHIHTNFGLETIAKRLEQSYASMIGAPLDTHERH